MEEQDLIRQAMSVLGSKVSEKKRAAAQENILVAVAARTGKPMTEEHKAALRAAQAERRARERAEREAANPPAPKRPRGRPKKVQSAEEKP